MVHNTGSQRAPTNRSKFQQSPTHPRHQEANLAEKQSKTPEVDRMSSLHLHNVGSCQNYGPFLGTLNIRCRIVSGTQKGTKILTTTHNPKPFIEPL